MLGILKTAKVGRLVPALAVSGILAASFLASAGATGINTVVGYGPCTSANLDASPLSLTTEGTELTIDARDRRLRAVVVPRPFVGHQKQHGSGKRTSARWRE